MRYITMNVFSAPCYNLFTVNPSSGDVTLACALDIESFPGKTYKITVSVLAYVSAAFLPQSKLVIFIIQHALQPDNNTGKIIVFVN